METKSQGTASTETFVQMPEESVPVQNDYYQLLGIEKDADAEAIRKAYRKAALKHHPDKNGNTDEAVVLFQAIQKAHETLSDPKKRKIYDKYGEKGVQMLDSLNMYAPFIDPDMLLAIHWFLMGATFAVTLLIIFAAFIVTKIDGSLSWPWVGVFSPLFILDAIILFSVLSTSISPESQMGHNPDQEISDSDKRKMRAMGILLKSFITIVVGLFILVQAFIACRLDGYIDWSWFKVLSPWLTLESMNLVRALIFTVPQLYKGQTYDLSGSGDEPQLRNITSWEKLVIIFSSFYIPSLRLAQILLILFKLDGSNLHWGVVFVPTWIWGVGRIIALILSYIALNQSIADPQQKERKSLWITQLILFIIGGSFVFITVGLIIRRLTFEDGYPPVAVILIPIFIILSILFLCFCCVLPMGIAGAQASLEEELRKDSSSTPSIVPSNMRITS